MRQGESPRDRLGPHAPAMGEPSAEELSKLLEETNFTEKEIMGFYTFGPGDRIMDSDFKDLCAANGLTAPGLTSRMWDLFDADDDGSCSSYELVKALNPLMRGTLEDVAGMFFDLYDVGKDGDLAAEEIIAVYSDLVLLTDGEPEHDGLGAGQRQRIADFVREGRGGSATGKFDKAAFVGVVRSMVEEGAGAEPFWTARNAFLLFITAWSEVGTSFALPAMGAMSSRIKQRFECGDAEIGSLTAAYYSAAMVGPIIGGIIMDKVGPGWVVMGANVIVTLGAACQAAADGASMFWLLLVGRLLLGLGGEVTPFTSVEILGKLFPDYFGLMAGIRNLIQSTSGFLAFVLIPMWADAGSGDNPADYTPADWNSTDVLADGSLKGEYLDPAGTSFALWMCALLGVASTVSNVVVKKILINVRARSASTCLLAPLTMGGICVYDRKRPRRRPGRTRRRSVRRFVRLVERRRRSSRASAPSGGCRHRSSWRASGSRRSTSRRSASQHSRTRSTRRSSARAKRRPPSSPASSR